MVAVLIGVGLLFFRVIQPFLVAIFVALMLAVLFAPMHQWLTRQLRDRRRIAAGLTTLCVIVLVLVPIGVTLVMAGKQAMQLGENAVHWLDQHASDGLEDDLNERLGKLQPTAAGALFRDGYDQLPGRYRVQLRDGVSSMADGMTSNLYQNTQNFLSDLFTFVISFGVMALGLYYLLADGEMFERVFHRLAPLEYHEEARLIFRFHGVCRGVVLGTVAAGLVQALLSGAAFAVLGVPQIWALMVLTMFCSFIPIVGATVVWGSVAAVLTLNGQVAEGVGLAIYGSAIIATSDNLVRAYVIGNQTQLHPFVALVSVLGALKLMGLWGVLVGPMLAAFFYALLNMVRERLVKQNMLDAQPPGELVLDPNADLPPEATASVETGESVLVKPR